MNSAPSRHDRIHGGLLGLLVADALGVAYEFHGPEQIPPRDRIEFDPPAGFRRAHPLAPRGAWSDDGAQALCLLSSLLGCGALDVEHLGLEFVAWWDSGRWAVDGVVFDVGVQTQQALARIQAGRPAATAGNTDERSNGNGALMRVLPLALWHRGPDHELVDLAMAQSRITHGHLRSQVCCAAYCLWARYLLEERFSTSDAAAFAALDTLAVLFLGRVREAQELHLLRDALLSTAPRGTGYVVDSFVSAVHCNREASYEAVVKAAIALGHDTDTTACIAGGIAGITHGVNGIPARWRQALAGQGLVEPLLTRLLGT